LAITQLKSRKALPARLRSLGLDEYWLQDQIANDTSLLGLGELEVVKKEKIQPTGGRIDFVLADPDGETRYEVEVMLGEVDESHIIRTLEYWDMERQRYSTVEHCAVIVAEEITARFFNVIRLLNRAVPIIAIQLSAFRFEDDVVLQFVRVLDIFEYGGEPQDGENAEAVDEGYWEKKSRPESLAIVEAVRRLALAAKGEPRITFNRYHIALGTTGYNFCWFYPKKTTSYCPMEMKVGADKREEIVRKLEQAGIEASNGKGDLIRLRLSAKDIEKQSELVTDIIRRAEEWSLR